ncbi:MAG: hypothetical protein ACYTGQ_08410 [Planctomycetota bacterium]|jgi:hypothetical protein
MNPEPGNRDVLEGLVLGHFEGALTEDEERELADLLETSTEAKRLFLSYMRLEGRLHSLGRDGFLREPADELCEDEWVDSVSDPHERSPACSGGRSPARLWASVSSIAACFAVTLIFVWGYQPSEASASGVLRQARLAVEELVDRSYRVTMTESVAENEAPIVSEMELHMRGGGRFVILPKNKRYVMGNDGTDFWTVILSRGPVWVTSDFFSLSRDLKQQFPNLPVIQLASNPDEPLLLELSSILESMENDYNVELLESEFSGLRHVRAVRRPGRRGGPPRIDLWVDTQTGVTRRLEWEFGTRKPDDEMRTRVSVVQIESREFSESWYGFDEHAPGRKVRRVNTKVD